MPRDTFLNSLIVALPLIFISTVDRDTAAGHFHWNVSALVVLLRAAGS